AERADWRRQKKVRVHARHDSRNLLAIELMFAKKELRPVHRITAVAGRQAMAKMFTRKAKHAIAGAAQRGAKNVKAVAGEALGAAARAATDIVLQRTAAVLGSGRDQLTRSRPAIKRAAGRAATNSVSKAGPRKRRPRRKPARAAHKTKRRAR
ncbi:MAG: hypothetical protein WBL98_03485, partial [Pseudolabrys sp.]